MPLVTRCTPAARPPSDGAFPPVPSAGAARALRLLRVAAAALALACVVAAVGGWLADSSTLVGLALVIVVEETLEMSVVAAALRAAARGRPLTTIARRR